MTIQLIGAGLGRTGTMSLKLALEQLLGGTCHHMIEVFGHPDEIPSWDAAMRGDDVDFPTLLEPYCAIVDYPGAAVWRELAAAFPDAPVLLSTRASPQVWWESASSTIFTSTQREPDDADEVWLAQRADDQRPVRSQSRRPTSPTPPRVMAAYEAHNAAVRAEIAPERLFEYQPGDGWAPLCAALGPPRAVRAVPPHEHPRGVPRAVPASTELSRPAPRTRSIARRASASGSSVPIRNTLPARSSSSTASYPATLYIQPRRTLRMPQPCHQLLRTCACRDDLLDRDPSAVGQPHPNAAATEPARRPRRSVARDHRARRR